MRNQHWETKDKFTLIDNTHPYYFSGPNMLKCLLHKAYKQEIKLRANSVEAQLEIISLQGEAHAFFTENDEIYERMHKFLHNSNELVPVAFL